MTNNDMITRQAAFYRLVGFIILLKLFLYTFIHIAYNLKLTRII
jgi:hypothetical protein